MHPFENAKTLAEIYKAQRRRLQRLALASGYSAEIAEDMSQEAFLRLHKIMQVRLPDCTQSYLTQIVMNLIREQQRQNRRRPVDLPGWSDSEVDRFAVPGRAEVDRQRQGAMAFALTDALGTAHTGHREFLLHYRDGLSKKMIANLLQANLCTVRSRILRYVSLYKEHVRTLLDKDCIHAMQEEIRDASQHRTFRSTGSTQF